MADDWLYYLSKVDQLIKGYKYKHKHKYRCKYCTE
jgi:hypothetical protein